MTADSPTILATSMGFNRSRMPWRPGPAFRYAFDLARASNGSRLCFISTATGDQRESIARFYDAFSGSQVRCSHLALFERPNVPDVRSHLLNQDVIWVDRGSVANLLAVWRTHELDPIMRECWTTGVVLAGESAGSMCWHSAGATDSYGALRTFSNGLGLLPYSNAVHYDQRRDTVQAMVAAEDIPSCYATDAGAGLRYRGTELVEVVSDRNNSRAYRIDRQEGGMVSVHPLEARRLRE